MRGSGYAFFMRKEIYGGWKMKKRILSLIVVFAMLIGCVPIVASAETSGTCGDNLTWVLENGILTISGTGEMTNYGYNHTIEAYVDSPWSNNSYSIKEVKIENGVTSIGSYAFEYCRNIKSIDIPNSVTVIGDNAFFQCYNLENIELPNGITDIGYGIFHYCDKLTDITIPDSVRHIQDSAFEGCSNLSNITIPENVISIGAYAFEGCNGLTSITIPNNVLYVYALAFSHCENLKSVYIGNGISVLDGSVFNSCSSLTDIYYSGSKGEWNNILFDGAKIEDAITIHYEKQSNTNIKIGEYIQMGTYYDEPILWRCVGIDPNGPLMFSDKVICLKAFDAAGYGAQGSHSRNVDYYISNRFTDGSNYWVDSNIRIWLNSNDKAGDIEWACGNPPTKDNVWNGYNAYDKEAGFLTNFTEDEKKAIKEVRQKTTVEAPEYESGIYDTGIEALDGNNYASAYGKYTNDKMFLLDSRQKSVIGNYSDILGSDYYIGKSSKQCAENCQANYSINEGDNVTYWLRTPYGNSHCWTGNYNGADSADDGATGVRPAFYLSNDAIKINGDGTESNPYKVKGIDGTRGNTNSTSAGAPIITAAELTHNGTTYDIMKKTVNFQEDTTSSAELTVDVDWNGNSNGKIYITQGTKKSIEVTNGKLTFKPGEDLSAGKTVYMLAIDEENGKSTSTKVKLKVNAKNGAEWNPDSGTDGFNFKLGQDAGFTIPDSVPVFGGTEIGFGLDFIPITFEYENENKINIAFGLDNSNIDKTTGRFKGFSFADYKATLKSGMKKSKNGYTTAKSNQQLVKELKKKYPDMKFDKVKFNVSSGVDTDVEVSGYAEMSYANGSWNFSEGFLAFNIEFSYEYQGQIFIWVVPCYYEFGGKVGGGIEGTIKNIQIDGFKPALEGYISAKVGASIGGGVGVAKVCTLGASGEGTLNIKTALHEKYLKSWAEADADFNVKVLGKTVAKKNFAHGEFTIYETGNKNALIKDKNGIELYSANDMYETISIDDIYPNESRIYAENPTEWCGDESKIMLMSADYTNKDLKLLAENIYTESAPQICEVDGKKIMVMQWDNTERADADRTMLVYSVYDAASKTWSAPLPVADDGTADLYPCFKDGYLVWQNEKANLMDDMTLADIAALGEICVSKWNGNGFDIPVQITNNNTLDTQPQIASIGRGASVIWTTNTENDILGITGKNAIMQSDFDGTNWNSPTEIKSNLNAVTNITVGNINNNFCVAYVADDDNDLNTIDDRDIRIIKNGEEIQLTDNDVLDSNPVFANNMIYYYSDGNIVYSDIDSTNTQMVFSEAKAGLTDTFVVDSNKNDDTAIWWTKAVEGGAEVYSSLYKDNEWSDEIQVTSIGNKAKYPSGIINDDGSMVVAFNNGILQDNEIVKTDLYTISVNPSYDLELTDAYFDEEAMTAYATVKNSGELAINGYTVTLADNQKTVTESLKAGESAEIEIAYNKPENLTKRDIELSVAMANGEEYNTENNTAVFSIGNADIAVENVAVDENETAIKAEVSNIGYDNAQNVKVQLRDGSADGTVIEEKTINLAVGAKETVEFTVDKSTMRFFDATKQLYVTANGDFDEVSVGNNDGYALISSPSGSADYETEILDYNEIDGKYVINSIARNNMDKSVSCIMYSAVYSSEGILKACGTVTADIDADNDTGVDITVPCTIETGDMVKTFMWTDKLEPLAKMGALVIE